MERRTVLSGTLAGMGALLAGETSATAQPVDDAAVAEAIDGLRKTVERMSLVSPELASIREQQRTFLKAHQKFPDFIEVGIGVWEDVYDWHVRHQLPPNITQTGEGRYHISLTFTTLVLRPDLDASYVGFGFDAR